MPEIEQQDQQPKRRTRWGRRLCAAFVVLVLVIFFAGMLLSPGKGDMSGTGMASEMTAVAASNVRLLLDESGWRDGSRKVHQEIMPRLLDMIDRADNCIILDMFLVNQFGELPETSADAQDITDELIQALVRKKRRSPDTFILFITDPINSVYEPQCPESFKPLADAGGCVVLTDLRQLPDSNHVYSPFYRVLRPLVTKMPFVHKPMLDHPFAPDGSGKTEVTLAQYARLLNFKANHRKIAMIRNKAGEWEALVSSANPHTASGMHGNAAVYLRAGPISDMVRSEYLIARSSILSQPGYCFGALSAPELTRELEQRLKALQVSAVDETEAEDAVLVQYLSEMKIGAKLDWMLDGAEEGDMVSLMMFYLSDPDAVDGMLAACERGAMVRILLDPNKDAFGFKKEGVPNRLVAERLVKRAEEAGADLKIRWFTTHGEQAHYKLIRIHNKNTGKEQLLTGSANFTRRNLRGYNLEAAVYVEGASAAGRKAAVFFDRAWNNRNETKYTAAVDEYEIQGMAYVFGRLKLFLGTHLGLGTY